jgi:hypothetical protein
MSFGSGDVEWGVCPASMVVDVGSGAETEFEDIESNDGDRDRSASHTAFEARIIAQENSCVLDRRNRTTGDACKEGYDSDDDDDDKRGLKDAAGHGKVR